MTCIAQLLQNTKKGGSKEREKRGHTEEEKREGEENEYKFPGRSFYCQIFRLKFDPGELLVLEEFGFNVDGVVGDSREDDDELILFNG